MVKDHMDDVLIEAKANNLGLVKGEDGQYYPPAPTQADQEQAMQQENPFEQFRNVRIPDQPIQYGGGLAESLLNNDEVPEEVRKKHWFIFHKDNVLTFLDEERKQNKLTNFDIIKIDMLNAMPYYDYTFNMEMELDIMRNVFETKLDRAMGIKGKNERVLLNSQFTEQKMVSEVGNTQGNTNSSGFSRRLLGRR